ncbi:hypothetical protein RhiirA4_479518 [Rhizophagus irregularis]|uniref:Uncharacterized protein n=1 Tax=Rhizophagus irregularis TaxID=588596 RepID=A0A2I1HGQ4_9GLOM|nr:hypothetical protein RhiirA4_479518 [Rhizophagus irregularis]
MLANEDTKFRWTIKIAKYNQDYVTSTDDNNKCNIDTHDIFSEEWFDTLKTKVNYRLRANYKKYKLAETKSIKNKIDKQVEITQEDQNNMARLATEPGEVKKAVDNNFARTFRKRNTLLETIIPLWQQIYKPAGKFKEAMEFTIEKITKKEWNKTVRELNKKSAARLSGINYKIIIQLLEKLVLLLVKFENLTLQTGFVPIVWKTSVILSISKPINFEYNILNT